MPPLSQVDSTSAMNLPPAAELAASLHGQSQWSGVADGFQPARPSALTQLLGGLDECPDGTGPDELRCQDRLVSARLGVASSLFRALRAKHGPTAQHCLRAALRCSVWGILRGMADQQLNQLEIAALLHDLGKIAVPDSILCKPGPLTGDETEIMQRRQTWGLDILAGSCVDSHVLEIIRCAPARFDGRNGSDLAVGGCEIPLEARMLAIADAFDAMTTDHVYRRAYSRERALAELFEHAGTQFDPQLVQEFAQLSAHTEAQILQRVSHRWVRQLSSDSADAFWMLREPLVGRPGRHSAASLFQQKLLDAMHDGVVFVDANGQIVLWNRGAERLTGMAADGVYLKEWSSELLEMRDLQGNLLRDHHCPVHSALRLGTQSLRRVSIGAGGQSVTVDLHVIPVRDDGDCCHGAAVLLQDVTSEATLEEKVHDLHEQATTDPLTAVANRAEFDRVHQEMVESNLALGVPCSIILCDIDHFKRINDAFGHQAGDNALVSYAGLLRRFCRKGDLVARYGGEEFVILCAECDNAAAARRAEEIRRELAETPQPALGGRSFTASFGVTELQLGDTPETMLRRADRALYQAKDEGRNRVVQLGSGMLPTAQASRAHWLAWLSRKTPNSLLERSITTNVPLGVVAEKLRGFIADHYAEIVAIEEGYMVLSINTQNVDLQRRVTDRPASLVVELRMHEDAGEPSVRERRRNIRTVVDVTIRPKRNRDRRRGAGDHAMRLLTSLKSYLIAYE